jgi:ubiquinone/menaquinone biosynthesis C-methylase UbiE
MKLFDAWPEKYEQWFGSPIGRLVRAYEKELILELLRPEKGESILDAGCGTGIFTSDILEAGASVVGLDISVPMLRLAGRKGMGYPFFRMVGDIVMLPFPEGVFDKVVSVTALEFVEDAGKAFRELSRVTRPGGCIVVATLNSLSPWAARRKAEAQKKRESVFREAVFRSPDEMRALMPVNGVVKTAIHFLKSDDPGRAKEIERRGRLNGLETGAFLAARWCNS